MLDYRQAHVQALAPILAEYPQINMAYVFGSYLCRERFRDVDIAVLLDHEANSAPPAFGVLGCRIGEALKLGCDVDLIILNSASIELRYTIIKSGCLLFARSETERIHYEISVVDEYLDYLDTLGWFDSQGGVSW